MWCSLRNKANRPLQRCQPSWGWQVGMSFSTAHVHPKLSQYALLPFPFCKLTLKHTINTENEEKQQQKNISIGNYSQTTFDQPGSSVSLALRVVPSNPDLSPPLDSLLLPNTFTSNTQSGFPGQWHTPNQITWYIRGVPRAVQVQQIYRNPIVSLGSGPTAKGLGRLILAEFTLHLDFLIFWIFYRTSLIYSWCVEWRACICGLSFN